MPIAENNIILQKITLYCRNWHDYIHAENLLYERLMYPGRFFLTFLYIILK